MHSLSQQVHSVGNRLGGNSQCCHVPWSSRLLTNEEAESKIAGLSSPRKCTHTPLPLTSLALQLPCPATCPWGFLLHTGSWSAPVSSFSKALCTGADKQLSLRKIRWSQGIRTLLQVFYLSSLSCKDPQRVL